MLISMADYDAWKAKQQQQDVAAANAVLVNTAQYNPDEVAGNLTLADEFAKSTGNPRPPLPLVTEFKTAFQQEITRRQNEELLKGKTRLSEWLRNPDNAVVAQDDLANIGWFEGFWRGYANTDLRATEGIKQMANQHLLELNARRALDQKRTFGEILDDERQKVGVIDPATGAPIPDATGAEIVPAMARWIDARYADLLGIDSQAHARDYADALGKNLAAIQSLPKSFIAQQFEKEAMVKDAPFLDTVQNYAKAAFNNPVGFLSWTLETVGETAPQLATVVAAGALTRNPAVAAGTTFATSYATERYRSPSEFFKDKGFDLSKPEDVQRLLGDQATIEDAARQGVIRGMVIGAFDALSVGIAGQHMVKNPFAEMVAQGLTQAALGGGGEYFARLAAGQQIDWNEVLAEAIAEFATAPVEAVAAGRKFLKDRQTAKQVEERQVVVDQIDQQSVNSKLRQRLPEAFRQAVDTLTADSPVANVYVPAEAFKGYFQSLGADPFEVADALDGVTRAGLQAALLSGDDIQIPTATYAAKIAGTEHAPFFRDNLKFSPDEMSAIEAAEFRAKEPALLDETWEQAQEARRQEHRLIAVEQDLQDEIAARLRAAGRSTEVATTEATLLTAFYRTMAQRTGHPLEDFLRQFPSLQIQGAIPRGIQLRDVDAIDRTLAEVRAFKRKSDPRQGLLEFIADYGGIIDLGGELKARNAETYHQPGKARLRLARPVDAKPEPGKAHGPDDVARAAVDAGFMADDPAVAAYKAAQIEGREAPDVVRALYDAIERELRGQRQVAARASDSRADAVAGVEEYLHRLGVTLDDTDAAIKDAIRKDQGQGRVYEQAGVLRSALRGLLDFVRRKPAAKSKVVEIGQIDPTVAAIVKAETGLDVAGYRHTIDSFAVRHIFKNHGDAKAEAARGQLPVTDADIEAIPAILGRTTHVITGAAGKRGQALLGYIAPGPDGSVFYIEEALTGRERLAALSMRKFPPAIESSSIAASFIPTAEPLPGGEIKITPLPPNSSGALFQDNPSGPRGSIQFPAGGIDAGETVVRLFENANLSTMLHESGHYFLAALLRIAEYDAGALADIGAIRGWWRDNAAEVAKDGTKATGTRIDEADVIAWLDRRTTGDEAKDAAIDTGAHEQWARAFEAYVMEGKAPSAELRSAFEKFRAWLLAVYRKLSGLDVTISDDIRTVMDRMLATDEEIAKAREAAGAFDEGVATAEQLGLTPDEFAGLQKLRQQAEDEAKARLLRETMEPLQRERERWYKEQKAAVTHEIEQEVNRLYVYRALEWMGNRRWLGEGQPEAMEDFRLSKEILVDRYGEGILKTLPRGRQTIYAVEGGVDPDIAADLFGFGSGDEMIRALEQAPSRQEAIRAEVDKEMRERYGDALNDGSVEERALDAVHSDKRGQFLAAELKAVAAVAGIEKVLTNREARVSARQTLSRMAVRDAVKPNRFLAAERRAAEDAERLAKMLGREAVWMNSARRRIATKARAALREDGTVDAIGGQIDQANRSTGNYNETVQAFVDAKRRQLLNHALYMESRIIAEEVEKAENFVAILNKASTRERIAGAGRRDNAQIDYLAAIDEILDRYDFRRLSGAAEQRVGALREYIDAMKAAGRENELAIPEAVIQRAYRAPYKTLSVEELRGVVATLKNIEHVAKRWDDVIDAQNQRKLEEEVDAVVGSIEQNVPKHPPAPLPTASERRRDSARKYLNLARNATSIALQMDGYKELGPTYNTIILPIVEAEHRLIVRKQKAAQDVNALFAVYSKAEQRKMNVREHIPALGYALTKWEKIAVALNTGNEINMERLTNPNSGRPMTEAQVAAVLASLDARDARFVQSVWSYIGSFKEDIAARERRVTGVEPEWVEARPVVVGGIELSGGYYPIKYDNRLGWRGEDQDFHDMLQSLQSGRFGKAQTKSGHLKARSESTGRALSLDIMHMQQHVNEVVYDLEMSEPIANVWRILQHEQVRGAFRDAGMRQEYEAFEIWAQDVGTGQIHAADMTSRVARAAKANFTLAALGGNVVSALSQVAGIAQSIAVLGPKDFAVGVQQMFRPGIADEIKAKSPFMTTRESSFNKEAYDFAVDPTRSTGSSVLGDFKREKLAPALMLAMTKIQWAVDVPTWLGGYNQGLRKFGGDETKALAYANLIVERAQGSGLWSTLSGIERGSVSRSNRQNAIYRLFSTLASYQYAKFRLAYDQAAKSGRIIKDEGFTAEAAQEAVSAAIRMVMLFTLDAVVMAAIKGKLPDDDDEKNNSWVKFLAKETAFGMMGSLPYVRDLAPFLDGYGGGGIYGSILQKVGDPLKQAWQGEFDKPLVKSFVSAAGLFTGAPSVLTNRLIDAGWRQYEGEDVSPAEYLLGKRKK